MKKVRKGDPLEVSAATFNSFIDAARAHRLSKRNGASQPAIQIPPPGVILTVKNDSGGDCARFEVLGLAAPVFAPTDNTADFSRGPVMSAAEPVDPDHLGSFVVVLEPIASGGVGQAIVQGAVYVKVLIADADIATWADVTDAETGHLTAAVTGSARILWRTGSGTGTVWCVCLLGVYGQAVGVGENEYEVLQTREEGGVDVAAWDYARLHE